MKKHIYTYLLILGFILINASCKNDANNAANTSPNSKTVDYEFSSTTSGNYVIAYTGTDGNNVFEQFSGTKWSKILTINDTKVTKVCTVTASYPEITTSTSVKLQILIDGSVVSTGSPTFTTSSYSGSINYTF